MSMDLPPKLWLPPKPAIIRSAPVQKANFLPGMFPFIPAQSAAAAVTALAFHDDAYSTTNEITVPAGLQAGDMMVLYDLGFDGDTSGGPSTLETPLGFTNWINDASAFTRIAVSYGIATGSETTLIGMDGDFVMKILAVFRPDAPITTITASAPTVEVTNGDPGAQSITATAGTLPLVALGFYGRGVSGGLNTPTFSPSEDAILTGTGVLSQQLRYLLQNASLSDVTINLGDAGSANMLAGGYLWAS